MNRAFRAVASLAATAGAAASLLGGACATAGSRGAGRVEEQVAVRPGSDAGERSEVALPVDARSPAVGETRAIHGTVDARTGRRTAEPAVEARLREPRRLDVQAGRVRRAADEYHPESGGLAWGFRVQVAAETDYGEAAAIAARVKERVGDRFPVYVEFVEPWYKVRVGDFGEEDAARALLDELRRAGWSDAWTVRTTIADGAAEGGR
ncbi:MAG TPA: SPOR domain-containing protein [Gemmatimonadota bacterium]